MQRAAKSNKASGLRSGGVEQWQNVGLLPANFPVERSTDSEI